MANDTTRDDFHQALLRLTKDRSPSVRANASVSLDRFKDPAGRESVLEMLTAPNATPDQQWEALRALRVIGTGQDLPLTTRFAASPEARVRDAAKDATQGIKDRM